MFDWLLRKKSKTQLGIDLGASSIKIVELGRKEERAYLDNYALLQSKSGKIFNIIDLKDEDIIQLLAALIKEGNFAGRRASVALPVDQTFSTVISLPVMPEEELAAAVTFEAQKYVPIPLNEVVLDWSIITADQNADQRRGTEHGAGDVVRSFAEVARTSGGKSQGDVDAISEQGRNSTSGNIGAGTIQILLLAVPKETINRITRIVSRAGLKVAALEQEAFSLARSLIGNDKNTFMIVDLGRRGTDIILLDQGFIKLSHSLESVNKEIIFMEIDRIVNIFQMRYNKKIGQCLLAGGRANEKDLFEFLTVKLKMPVRLGDPFARVSYDSKAGSFLKELGPQFSVAVGLAMRDHG
ncbi:MAG: Type IV pilus assembly protein PilM [Parcubacteria group bacterium GW2011_GWA2_43_9b]|nr:MAG: Type IV pilus assembly protein PilM [Parcubacteria group bacterium GW2011_GWA2_43_9b]